MQAFKLSHIYYTQFIKKCQRVMRLWQKIIKNLYFVWAECKEKIIGIYYHKLAKNEKIC